MLPIGNYICIFLYYCFWNGISHICWKFNEAWTIKNYIPNREAIIWLWSKFKYYIFKEEIKFFEYKGRRENYGDSTIKDKKNFTIIFGNKFFYNGKDRDYFDYKNKYSVKFGESCPTNSKKCGILDSAKRILCLPIDEDCPLNGFFISGTNQISPFDALPNLSPKKTISYGGVLDVINLITH